MKLWCLNLVFCRNCGGEIPSEESRFCPGCGNSTDGSTKNETKQVDISQQNGSKHKPQKLTKARSGGTGKIIGGFLLILIGIAVAGYGFAIYNIQTNNLQTCSSIEGTLGQLDPNNASICENAPGFIIVTSIAALIGIIMLIIGIILIAFGVKQKSK